MSRLGLWEKAPPCAAAGCAIRTNSNVQNSGRLPRVIGENSAALGRQRRVSYRHFRHDRRRRNLTLALAQPLAGFLPAFLGLPMSGVSGCVREDEFGGLEHGYLLRSITTGRQPPFRPPARQDEAAADSRRR